MKAACAVWIVHTNSHAAGLIDIFCIFATLSNHGNNVFHLITMTNPLRTRLKKTLLKICQHNAGTIYINAHRLIKKCGV
jgi:hypothetical protein